MASMAYKTYVVVWLAARATARGAAGAAVCLCAARALALPGAPLAPPGRLARSGALAPCAGGPPGVFRRLRAAVALRPRPVKAKTSAPAARP